ncbi:hypothetical protein FLP10_05065 [Agromyces intestinalis]|uniref:Uncharacterized protein n=1 Tax=Agromyces intestinalis TaxID=2592652 RepID=A0A5C1YCQ0_9MICO|nr:hypothetical protein [Agromyces intestinalis]QEO13863.1 hypothetical protein FLP10_05065 [Agromyces intestinalis]
MTDFVDPLEEPFDFDRNPRGALDPNAEAAYAAELEAERRDAEDTDADPDLDADVDVDVDGVEGTTVTSASEGDPLDPETPVDNLE